MPLLTQMQTAMSAGEVAPSLYARTDLAKYHVALKRARNFFILAHGGASNRPGTAFCGRAKDSTNPVRLIGFTFSTLQTYMLEFGHLYMRVLIAGGYVLEPTVAITAITQASPGVFTAVAHGFSNGDWVFVAGVVGMTQVNSSAATVRKIANATANTFTLTDLDGNAISTAAYSAYISGGTVARIFTLTTTYAGGDLALLKFAQSADTLTITHPSYAPADLTRTQHWAWSLTPIVFGTSMTAPTGVVVTPSTGASTTTYRYVVTALKGFAGEESRASVSGSTAVSIVMSQNAGARQTVTWTTVAGAVIYRVYRQKEVANGAPDVGEAYGYVGTCYGPNFVDTNITPDFTQQPPLQQNPFANSPITGFTITAGGAGYTSASVATISDAGGGTGWAGFPIVVGGAVVAIVTTNAGQNYVTPVLAITVGAGATATIQVGGATGNYPGCVTYFQQRKTYGGALNNPQTFNMGKTGLFKNFDISSPAQPSDAISATIAGLQQNALQHFVPMTDGIIAFTTGGAWKIGPGSNSDAVTPSSIAARPQSYVGCSALVPPIVINYDILYVQAKGSTVRDLAYNFYANIFTGADVSILANHLFFGHTIVQWGYAEEPFKLVWAIREDGALLSFTYLKEQEVYAWARHDSGNDTFLSVATVAEGTEDAAYFVVQRTIPGVNGGLPVKYIERLHSRNFLTNGVADVTKAWFVDSGVQYSGAPATVIPGGDHLNGQTVAILSDGNVVAPQVVVNGTITLPFAGSLVTYGVPYLPQLQTLELDFPEQAGTSQGKRKKIAAVTVRVENTRGLKMGPDFTRLKEYKDRSGAIPVAQAIPLFTGNQRMDLDPNWGEGVVCVQQDSPLPITVLAFIPEQLTGDDPG